MSAEPYTDEERGDDNRSWALATPEQMAAAFGELLAAASAVALSRQVPVLIETLRDIRAERGAS